MPSGVLDLSSLPITDRDLDVILSKSCCTYPKKPLKRLALDYCSQLTCKSGKYISAIQTLTHLSLVQTINEEEEDVVCGLENMPSLVFLDLSGTLGWKPKAIAQWYSLKELILQDWCWDESLEALDGLSLKKLDISNNFTLTCQSAASLNRMLSLEVLDISNTSIPPKLVERSGLEVIKNDS